MKDKKETIETKIEEVNKLLKKFESGSLDIEESLNEYNKAMVLIKEIQKELEAIEIKINEITEED